jgi:hypothetical protein
MDERQIMSLFYNCDDEYFPRHKFKEHKIFMAMYEDVSEEEAYVSPVDVLPQPTDLTPPSDPP